MAASDLFKMEFREDFLKVVFAQSIYGTSSVGIDYINTEKFKSNLEFHVSVISRKVLSGEYSFTNYRQLLVSKGAGKLPRVLSIPTVRDRLTLKVLSDILGETFGERCKTPQPQLIISNLSHAISTKQYSCYIKLDLDNFYGSIPHIPLMKVVRSRIRKKEILSLISSAIKTKTVPFRTKTAQPNEVGLPQGLSISNQLSNLYASKLDESIRRKFPEAMYCRYVDDIIVLCSSDDVSLIMKYIKTFIQKIGLKLNAEKCTDGHIETDSFDYLGYRFQDGIISVRESSKRRIENSIEKELRSIAHSNHKKKDAGMDLLYKNLYRRITGCKVTYDGIRYARFGWLFYYSRINDIAYLGKLDSLVKKIANRYKVSLDGRLPKFKTAYYQMRFNCRESNYFPVFDFTRPPSFIRSQLTDLVSKEVIDRYSDDEIKQLFQKVVNRIVRTLEKDVGMVS